MQTPFQVLTPNSNEVATPCTSAMLPSLSSYVLPIITNVRNASNNEYTCSKSFSSALDSPPFMCVATLSYTHLTLPTILLV